MKIAIFITQLQRNFVFRTKLRVEGGMNYFEVLSLQDGVENKEWRAMPYEITAKILEEVLGTDIMTINILIWRMFNIKVGTYTLGGGAELKVERDGERKKITIRFPNMEIERFTQ